MIQKGQITWVRAAHDGRHLAKHGRCLKPAWWNAPGIRHVDFLFSRAQYCYPQRSCLGVSSRSASGTCSQLSHGGSQGWTRGPLLLIRVTRNIDCHRQIEGVGRLGKEQLGRAGRLINE